MRYRAQTIWFVADTDGWTHIFNKVLVTPHRSRASDIESDDTEPCTPTDIESDDSGAMSPAFGHILPRL